MKKFFKRNPFFWTGVFFAILSIIFHMIGIEETAIGYIVYFIPFLVFIIWLIYFPINFFSKTGKNKNDNLKNKKKVGWGSFIGYLLIIGCILIGIFASKLFGPPLN